MQDNFNRDTRGRFAQGGPPGPGRPAGQPEKTTRNARQLLIKIIDKQVPYIEEALDQLRKRDAGEYLGTVARLLPFVLPKMEQIDLEASADILTLDKFMETLTYEQLYALKHNRWPERLKDDNPRPDQDAG